MSTDNPYASPTMPASAIREVPRLEPPQSVSFQLTEEEVLAASKHLNASNRTLHRYVRRRQRRLLVLAAIMAIASWTIASTDSTSNPLCWLAAVLSVTYCGMAFILPARTSRSWGKLTKDMLVEEQVPYDVKTKVTLLDEGIEYANDDGHTFRRWHSIPKVERIAGLLMVYESPLSATPIPGRAFFDEAAFEGYCNLAERLWREAHPDLADESNMVTAD